MVHLKHRPRDTIAAPYVVQPSGSWDGFDGNFTSFLVGIGKSATPQTFRMIPATVDSHIAVVSQLACTGPLAGVDNCGSLRGVNDYNGRPSRGFTETSSWTQFQLSDEITGQTIFPENATYGYDTVQMPSAGGKTNTLDNSVISEIVQENFWLGSIGIGDSPIYSNQGKPIAGSFLSALQNQSLIPSRSYAYTPGQYYNNKPGSLILGGYDSNKMSSGLVVTPIDASTPIKKLMIGVKYINAGNAINAATVQALSDNDSVKFSIDSSVTRMYLPESACNMIAQAYNLTYDSDYNLYRVDDTTHQTLKAKNPTLTFRIGGSASSSGGLTNIILAYNALDLNVGIPLYNETFNYFPISKASDPSQYTLGRAFLQEAYLVVDWQRGNFTIGPLNTATSAVDVLAITTPTAVSTAPASTSSAASNDPSSSGISAGAIAGIVIAVLLIAAIAGVVFWLRRRPKDKRWSRFSTRKSVEQPPPAYDSGAEFYSGDKAAENMTEVKAPPAHLSELYDDRSHRAELTSDNVRKLEEYVQDRELMSTPVAELVGDHAGTELEITSNPARSSIASGSGTARNSVISPTRSSLGPRSPPMSPPLGPHPVELE